MGRIGKALERAKEEKRAAFIAYLCAGDPDLDTTAELVLACAKAGADIIELGVPFSDPTADGPTIQRAAERSLEAGTTVKGVLDLVRAVRRESEVPIVLFGYYNPIVAYGESKLVADAADAGIDGFLIVDLPPEEAGDLRSALTERGLDFVPLVAPTSNPERVTLAAEAASSFIYYVSMTGVTGADATDLGAAAADAAALREKTGKRVALGFGIQHPEQVAQAAAHVDAIVVGSAIVGAIEKAGDRASAVSAVSTLVASLVQGLGAGRG